METICRYRSPLGGITLTSDGQALTGLRFDGQRQPAGTLAKPREEKLVPVLEEAVTWLDVYFSGRDPGFTPALELNTTPFCRAVCEIVRTIPYGKTMSYGEIARQIARQRGIPRMSAQAVGGAVGRNPIALIIPCHRVIGQDGSLTGYGGGMDRKEKLLRAEGVKIEALGVRAGGG